jgi:4-oxalmesaconate hydratase
MIVDSHAHLVAPEALYAWQGHLISNRANPDGGAPKISDEALEKAMQGHFQLLDSVGTDVQFISPRPYAMMHSLKPAKMVQKWNIFMNDLIARQVAMHPERYRGVCGLPQTGVDPLDASVAELERCVKELGFVGCLINPDPMEGEAPPPPGLGDKYWYPLYAKMVELDVPALIHSASCCSPRESYTLHFINEESIAIISLLESTVFEDFPTLKIVISHGGGAIPYQIGRFRSWHIRRGRPGTFDEQLRKLYYDTCLYSKESLDFLCHTVGSDRVLFGTEKPGTGSAKDPATGFWLDDVKRIIDGIESLTAEDRYRIYEGNARNVYPRAFSGMFAQFDKGARA